MSVSSLAFLSGAFLDALASLDSKLSVSEWVIYAFRIFSKAGIVQVMQEKQVMW